MSENAIEIVMRPYMLEKPVEIYEHDYSKYPDKLRVSFADGRTFVYDIHTDQPAPVVVENIRIIRKWKRNWTACWNWAFVV